MKENVEFKELSHKETIDFLLPRHYSGRKPNVSYSFGCFIDGKLYAVCTFGKPASHSLCIGVCGRKWAKNVYELNRLCRLDEKRDKFQLSEFVSYCLRKLKPKNLIIISYADTAMNHHGFVYQACNFIYTGKTKKRTDKYTPGNKHSRHYEKDANVSLRKVRSSKHRYVYITANKRLAKKMLKDLNYPILEYPKGDNSKYKLGDYLEPEIIETS